MVSVWYIQKSLLQCYRIGESRCKSVPKVIFNLHPLRWRGETAQMSFICHIHNYTEYNQQWNVFSAFNPSKHTHTHLEQWAADIAMPREQLGVRCLAQGSHLSRGQFLPEPRFEPITSGNKSNALSTSPRLPISIIFLPTTAGSSFSSRTGKNWQSIGYKLKEVKRPPKCNKNGLKMVKTAFWGEKQESSVISDFHHCGPG